MTATRAHGDDRAAMMGPGTLVLGGVWLALACSLYGVALLPLGHRMIAYLTVHTALFALALALAWHARPANVPANANAALTVGIVAHFVLAGVPPLTSSDATRYVWDGAVVLEGVDPYRVAPNDARLDGLAERFVRPPDHGEIPTCYPPVSLALFVLVAASGPALAPSLLALLLALAAAALLGLVHRALSLQGRPADVMLLALSPLLLFETAVGGHLDVLVALALSVAAITSKPDRGMTAGLMIGLAAMIKVWPIALAVVLLRHVARARFAAGLALGLLPLALATVVLGHAPVGSLSLVAQTWSFGSPVWLFVRSLSDDEPTLRMGLAAASGLLCLAIGWRSRTPAGALLAGTLAILVASPTLYPWYAVSVVPLALLAPPRGRAALALSFVLPFSYEVVDVYQRDGTWRPAAWPAMATLLVLIGIGLWALRPERPLAAEVRVA